VERPKKNPWESLVAVLPAHHEPLTTIIAVIAAFHCSKQVQSRRRFDILILNRRRIMQKAFSSIS